MNIRPGFWFSKKILLNITHNPRNLSINNYQTTTYIKNKEYSYVHNKLIICPSSKVKWGLFDRTKPIPKMLLASWNFETILKRPTSFNAENLGSIGQSAANLQAIKLWEWFDPGRASLNPGRSRLHTHFSWNGRISRLFLVKSNFNR